LYNKYFRQHYASKITAITKIRNYKFRVYPTKQQEKKLENNLDVCRWLYNHYVKNVKNRLFSRNDMNYMLTELKQSEPWLYNYHAKMLQMVSTQISSAKKSMMVKNKNVHKVGELKPIRYGQYKTFTYNQSGYEITKHGNTDLLWLSKIGCIEIRIHRQIPDNVKQVTLSKTKSRKWFALITCNIDTIITKLDFKKAVGIDVGLKNFAYDSQGHAIQNPKNLEKMLKPLARIQRKISRRHIGSQNRRKAVRFYQIIHERIANRRKDFLHQISKQYAKNYGICFVERLAKLNMVKNHRLARGILDAGWGTFVRMLDYKCKILVEVSARNTTINCSRCGSAVPKSLAVRIHRCNVCDLVLDRDYNASINILKKGLEIFEIKLPQELREVTPVKIPRGVGETGKHYRRTSSSSHRLLATF
jgi:putative transposase